MQVPDTQETVRDVVRVQPGFEDLFLLISEFFYVTVAGGIEEVVVHAGGRLVLFFTVHLHEGFAEAVALVDVVPEPFDLLLEGFQALAELFILVLELFPGFQRVAGARLERNEQQGCAYEE